MHVDPAGRCAPTRSAGWRAGGDIDQQRRISARISVSRMPGCWPLRGDSTSGTLPAAAKITSSVPNSGRRWLIVSTSATLAVYCLAASWRPRGTAGGRWFRRFLSGRSIWIALLLAVTAVVIVVSVSLACATRALDEAARARTDDAAAGGGRAVWDRVRRGMAAAEAHRRPGTHPPVARRSGRSARCAPRPMVTCRRSMPLLDSSDVYRDEDRRRDDRRQQPRQRRSACRRKFYLPTYFQDAIVPENSAVFFAPRHDLARSAAIIFRSARHDRKYRSGGPSVQGRHRRRR